MHVQYGCGLSAPKNWVNFDTSPTLWLQKLPLIGWVFYKYSSTKFPKNILYGNIIKGLPVKQNSCDAVYCSHILEHLAKEDFYVALQNTYKILKEGGAFRVIVPDLEVTARQYLTNLEHGRKDSNSVFIRETHLGLVKRPKNIIQKFIQSIGNSSHLWMWDSISLSEALKEVGFKNIRGCIFNDSLDPLFKEVENESRFINAVAIECFK